MRAAFDTVKPPLLPLGPAVLADAFLPSGKCRLMPGLWPCVLRVAVAQICNLSQGNPLAARLKDCSAFIQLLRYSLRHVLCPSLVRF
jgi:hypothetical protein